MNSSLAATVVVPTYRGAARLPALLDSLAAQNPDAPAFDVIVVVDGVDDGSVALLDAESRITVRHILFPENRGRVAALNAGFSAARGSVLIRCDDDLVVPSGFVQAHVAAHSDTEAVGVVGLTRDIHDDSPYARAYGEYAAENSYQHALGVAADARWRHWAANCSITRSTWETIGGYDPQYRAYGWEDVDYGYRLAAAGLPILVVEAATAEHHGPARSAQARALKAFESGTARSTFRSLHPEAPVDEASPGNGLWGLGVATLARTLTSHRAVARWGGFVDHLLPITPRFIGRKLVALAVEGSGLAGNRTSATPKGQL